MWVRTAEIDEGLTQGVSAAESQRVRQLAQDSRDLKRTKEILKQAASFLWPELCATRYWMYREVVERPSLSGRRSGPMTRRGDYRHLFSGSA